MRNSGVAANNAAVADGDPRQDCAKLANPDIIFDDDRLTFSQRTFYRRHVRAIGILAAIITVIVVGNVNFATHEDIVTDLNMIDAANMDVFTEAYAIANDKPRLELLDVIPFTIRFNGFEPEASAGTETFANIHVTKAAKVRVRIDVAIPTSKIQV